MSGSQKLPDENAVQMSLITFNYSAEQVAFSNGNWTNNAQEFTSKLGDLDVALGTNWADGLRKAQNLAKPNIEGREAETYVLLVTDGEPSQYWHDTDMSGSSVFFVPGEGSYLGAREEARGVVRNGDYLYGVFAFGNSDNESHDYLGKLMNYAYDNPYAKFSYSFYAQDSDALSARLNSILKVISMDFDFADVEIKDGITSLTDVTFEADSQNNKEEFHYEISYRDYSAKEGGGFEYTTVVMEEGSDDDPDPHLTVTGSGNNQTVTIPSVTYHALKNNALIEITTEETSLAGAEFNEKTGETDKNVVWNLRPVGAAADSHYAPNQGWTYKVKFKIWPSQVSYDILAALNNGVLTWGDNYTYSDTSGSHTIYADVYMAQIYQENGQYIQKTNVEKKAYVDYSLETKTTTGEGVEYEYEDQDPILLPKVGGMPLDNTQIELQKLWETDLSDEDYKKISSVDMYVLIDDPTGSGFNKTDPSTYYKKVTLTKENSWKAYVSVAPGIYDEKYLYKTTGHTYSVMEPDIDGHFEFESVPTHPMLDGTTTGETQLHDMKDFWDKEAKSVVEPGQTNYKKASAYTLNEDSICTYSVTNVLKGGINIYKNVDVEDSAKQYYNQKFFTFEIKLYNQKGDPVVTPSGADGGGALGYRIYAPDSPLPDGVTVQTDTDGTRYYVCNGLIYTEQTEEGVTGFYARGSIDNTGTISLKIRPVESIRIVNVPKGTLYTVEEKDISATGCVFKNSVWEVPGSDPEKKETITDSTITNEHEIVPDAENNVTFTNKLNPASLKIKKLDGAKTTETGLSGAVFQLFVDINGVKQLVSDVEGYKEITGLGTVTVQGAAGSPWKSAFMTDGTEQTLGLLPDGTYYLREVYWLPGYVNVAGDIEFKVENSVISCAAAASDPNLDFTPAADGDTPTLALLKITNEAGAELPSTGGPGTMVYMLGGIMLILASALAYSLKTYSLRMRNR